MPASRGIRRGGPDRPLPRNRWPSILSKGRGWHTAARGQIWAATCLCAAENGGCVSKRCKTNGRKKCFVTSENDTKFKFRRPEIRRHWNAARLDCRVGCAAFPVWQQNGVAAETAGPQEPEVCTVLPSTADVCQPLPDGTKVGPDSPESEPSVFFCLSAKIQGQ